MAAPPPLVTHPPDPLGATGPPRPAAGHPLAAYLARRVLRFLLSLALLVTATFGMVHLIPGDPVRAALGVTASTELVAARAHDLGLDLPLWQQYARHVANLFRGDLGTSMVSGLPVSRTIADRLPYTAMLALVAFAVVMLTAVPAGMAAAAWTRGGRRRAAELLFTAVSGLLAVVPEFLLAVALIVVFAITWELLPVADVTGELGPSFYVLPALALAVGPAAALARIVRVEALAVLASDYMRTARAKRLPARLIHLRHALPNLLTGALTLGGLLISGLVAGSVLVENVFAWPGLGSALVEAIKAKDYPVVQGVVLVYGGAVLLVNLAVDVALGRLDPRSTLREDG
ncbi:MAG: ABC transporter permease [Nonomuraea sp.]|nr:ABC transporter permease [Nonomuraea sp.]NUP62793.1 ABC transporter permease [Nonomuraea sp.]NUP80085.1 ABC transporter permease [Nonomuraea sp.]NUS01857.1 ABC transporter permease [Nonomuraea sp.]NUT44692.1 ABC transporter permease [Thermoactinospora sp.]